MGVALGASATPGDVAHGHEHRHEIDRRKRVTQAVVAVRA